MPLPFFVSISEVFDFAATEGFFLPPAAFSPALAVTPLSLPSCFLASFSEIFDFGAADGLCRPAAIAVELAPNGFYCLYPPASCFPVHLLYLGN